ncbi:MAG: SAM-dependent methyltransferase [Clostridia bacterium]|nr:SAM-dependent methyltransferase [Clostridia bacterium]
MIAQEQFAALAMQASRATALKKMVFSRPIAGDNAQVLRIVGTLRVIGGAPALQLESFRRDNKAVHENLPLDKEGEARLATRVAEFGQVNLLTTAGDADYRQNKKGHAVALGADKLARKLTAQPASTVALCGNDKEKSHILSGAEPFLRHLGVADENGRVYDKKRAKFRQINRFLELIRDVLDHLPKDEIRILDLCCGKSYLSFAVYHYFANVLGLRVSMTGVDLKEDVVAYCNEVARAVQFEGLEFLCGDVGKYETEQKPQLVISLHACDVATDLVLERALAFGARVILATPCCHHELNHTLNCPTLSFIAEHSMLRQKLCDAATDALRLKMLESKGYDVAALELIDPDETPKNIMLRAIYNEKKSKAAREKAAVAFAEAKRFLLGE